MVSKRLQQFITSVLRESDSSGIMVTRLPAGTTVSLCCPACGWTAAKVSGAVAAEFKCRNRRCANFEQTFRIVIEPPYSEVGLHVESEA